MQPFSSLPSFILEQLPEEPTWEETKNWTLEDWRKWRDAHPRFEPTPGPTPRRYQRGGVADYSGYDFSDFTNHGPPRGGGPTIGFYGGTDANPQYWTSPSTGKGGRMPGSSGFGPWGASSGIGGSWTDIARYGNPAIQIGGLTLHNNDMSLKYRKGGIAKQGKKQLPKKEYGTDTIPAALTPGEMILTKNQQKAVTPIPGKEHMLRTDQKKALGAKPSSKKAFKSNPGWRKVPRVRFDTGGVTVSGGGPKSGKVDYRGAGLVPTRMGGVTYWGTKPAWTQNPPGSGPLSAADRASVLGSGYVYVPRGGGFGRGGALGGYSGQSMGGGWGLSSPLSGAGWGTSTFMGGGLGGYGGTLGDFQRSGPILRQLSG